MICYFQAFVFEYYLLDLLGTDDRFVVCQQFGRCILNGFSLRVCLLDPLTQGVQLLRVPNRFLDKFADKNARDPELQGNIFLEMEWFLGCSNDLLYLFCRELLAMALSILSPGRDI